MTKETIGIIGPGKLGIVLAQLSVRAGYSVLMTGSERDTHLSLTLSALVPGARVVDRSTLIKASDIVILAIPLSKYREISQSELDEKLVIDAMNFWWEVDGEKQTILLDTPSSSEQVQHYFTHARIVKALSHVGYHDLYDHANQISRNGRRAIGIASNSEKDQKIIGEFVDRLGFDPIILGDLSRGHLLEPGQPAFGVSLEKDELFAVINDKAPTH